MAMDDNRFESTAKLKVVLGPFSELLTATAKRDPHIKGLGDFVTKVQPHIGTIRSSIENLEHFANDSLTPDSSRTTQAEFQNVVGSLWSEVNGMLPAFAFGRLPSAEATPSVEAFHRAVVTGAYSQGRLDGVPLSLAIPRESLSSKLATFRDHRHTLKRLQQPPTPAPPMRFDLERIRAHVSALRPLFRALLCGLSSSVACSCLHNHGVLLFLESHLRGEAQEKHCFHLAVSRNSPYTQQPGWRECDIEVSIPSDDQSGKTGPYAGTLCDHMRKGDKNQTEPVILALQGTNLEYKEWDIPRDNAIRSADRVRLAHMLDKAPNLTALDKISLGLVFALCTFHQLESQIHPQPISKDHIYFLQTKKDLLLQPFLFYDFSMQHHSEDAGTEYLGGYSTPPLSWYQTLAILLLEVFRMKRIEKYANGDKSPVSVVSQELNTPYWTARARSRLKEAISNCLFGPHSARTSEDFFLTNILGYLTLQYLHEKNIAGVVDKEQEYGNIKKADDNIEPQVVDMKWTDFDASFIKQTVSCIPLDPHVLQQIPLFDDRRAGANSCDGLYEKMVETHKVLETFPGHCGVSIAVLDTGIETENSDFGISGKFKGRVVQSANFFKPEGGDTDGRVTDYHGHGTFVAGIIARMTRLTKLYVGKVSDGRTELSDRETISAVARGIRHAWKEWKVDIINLSLGWRRYDNAQLKGVKEAIAEAYSHGVIIVAAPGNHGYNGTVAWPAGDPWVLCANSLDGNGKPSTANPRTEKPDSLYMCGEGHASSALNGGVDLRSGSSFSTAAMTAVCATMLEFMNAAVSEDCRDAALNRESAAKLRSCRGMAHVLRQNASEIWTTDNLEVCHVQPERVFKPGMRDAWATVQRSFLVSTLYDL